MRDSSDLLTVFTTGPDCHKCNLTKRTFDNAGVPYREVDLREDPETAEALRAEGFAVAPVVSDGLTGETWSDFRFVNIRKSIQARADRS